MNIASTTSSFTVLLVQNMPKWPLSKNLVQLERLLSKAKLGIVDLIVFPEFVLGDIKSKTLSKKALRFKSFCRENSVNAVSGSIPEEDNGKWYNTSFLIGRTGDLIGRYRKMHLGPLEGGYAAGDEIGIFSIDVVKVGLGICRDLWFPEYWRILKKRGASLFIVPSFIEKPEWGGFLAMAKARALENQVYLLLCNNGQSGVGRSCVMQYDSSIVSSLREKPGILFVDLDLSHAIEWEGKIGYERRTDIYDVTEKRLETRGLAF